MSNFTVTTSAVFLPEVWAKRVLVATESKLVAAKLVSRYDQEVSGFGDVVHIPNVSNFSAARTKSADTDLTYDAITETEKQISIDQHKYLGFVIEDRLAKQAAYDLPSFYTEKAGYSVAKAVDTSLLSLYTDFTTTDVGSYEADITAATMTAAYKTLAVNDVPSEDLAYIFHPYQMDALLTVQDFVTTTYQGEWDKPTRVQTGPSSRYLYGTLYGVPVYTTTNVQTTAGTTSSVHNVLIHKDAWALAMQISPRVQSQYDIDVLGDKYVVDVLYGVLTTRPDFGVEVRTTS